MVSPFSVFSVSGNDVGGGGDQRAVADGEPGAAKDERRAARLLERADRHDRRLDALNHLGKVGVRVGNADQEAQEQCNRRNDESPTQDHSAEPSAP